MTSISSILAKATDSILPTSKEEAKVAALAKSLLAKTERAASKHTETRGIVLGGSYAKGTWLPRHVDLDIFVKFDPYTPEEQFERIGLAVGAEATRGHPRGKKYAQHPYTEATIDGIRVNIVPCYAVEGKHWKSAADRSPFHVDLVKVVSEEKKRQIKLLKRFMMAVGAYGAEIQTRGFSGYVAEVLVLKHGDLRGVLTWFADLRPHSEDRLLSLPDPVDEGRDLATAVSGEILGRMVLASREFLRSPSLAYFQKMSGRTHSSLRGSVFAVVFSHQALSEDTLWGELRRTTRHLARHLEVSGFKVARMMAASNNRDRSAILLIPEITSLPQLEQRLGPTVDRRKDVDAFVESNRKSTKLVWVDDDARVRLLRPRAHLEISDLLADISKGKAGAIGASRELEKGMRKSALVLHGRALARAASSASWLEEGVREIVSDVIGTR
ncbi:MAG: CCA tRNA nucleotidyltransferase [Thaumarchaeota archaeon]|nr:CCA tRNA nucleotidyltransferase [Nitrososphaerota archaeon]